MLGKIMRIRLTLFALAAAASLALTGCGQQKPQATPPAETAAPPMADDGIPPDMSATAPDGVSPHKEFAGEAPVESNIDVVPAPSDDAPAAEAPKPGAIEAAPPPPAPKPVEDQLERAERPSTGASSTDKKTGS